MEGSRTKPRRIPLDGAWVALLTLAGLALRLRHLDALSVWYDEGWTLFITRFGAAEALRQIVRFADPHPPGYYLLLIPWSRLFGGSASVARAFSAIVGAATIPALYALGRGLYDRRTGLLAAALLALAPAHIAYSQEARMYALQGLWVVLLLELVHRYVHRRVTWRRWQWAALVLVESAALYTHFFSAFVLVGLSLWACVALALLARRDGWRPLGAWLLAQAAVLLSLAPWASVLIQRVSGHVTASTYTAPLPAFVREVWSFLLAGQIDLLAPNRLYAGLALAALALVGIGGLLALWRDAARRDMAYLVVQVAAMLLGVYLLMRLRPGFHPRYLLMALPPLLVWVARLATAASERRSALGWGAALGLLAIWLAASLVGGRLAAATNPWRDDARSVAAYLRGNLPAGSVVIGAYPGWELDYYLQGSALVSRYYGPPELARGATEELAGLLRAAPRAAYVRWRQSDTDHTGQIPYALALYGHPTAELSYPGYQVTVYTRSDREPALRECATQARFGPLTLLGAQASDTVPVGQTIAVALRWRLEAPVPHDLKVALALLDARGRILTQQDRYLRDALGQGTARWQARQEGASFHTLAVPVGVAPLSYRVQVAVYHEGDLSGLDVLDASGAPAGRTWTLCELALAPAQDVHPPPAVDRTALGLTPAPEAGTAATGLALVAQRIERTVLRPGERLTVLLEWRNDARGALPDLRPELRLTRDGQLLAAEESAPVYGAYPTTRWAPGESVLEWRDLVLPSDLPPGAAQVELCVPGQAPIALGTIEIGAVPRIFQPPPMERSLDQAVGSIAVLAGYDLSARTLSRGGNLVVTLYWRALAPTERELTVFVHLVGEHGRLVAQHDGPPVAGARPTTGWVAGEYLRDEHVLAWLEPGYGGTATLHVGLYDPTTGERVLAASGASSLVLPEAISVE